MILQLHITKDQSAAFLKAVKDVGKRALPALGRAMDSGAQEVLGRAVNNRFVGRGPFPVSQNRLGVVTNRLRKSMRTTLPQVNPAAGTVSISMGSNVSYYAGHEFGFRGRVQVKQHTRRAIAGLSRNTSGKARDHDFVDSKLTRGQISKLKGVIARGRSSGGVTVRQHSRRMNIPARRPLGTELAAISTRLSFFKKFSEAIRILTAFSK